MAAAALLNTAAMATGTPQSHLVLHRHARAPRENQTEGKGHRERGKRTEEMDSFQGNLRPVPPEVAVLCVVRPRKRVSPLAANGCVPGCVQA